MDRKNLGDRKPLPKEIVSQIRNVLLGATVQDLGIYGDTIPIYRTASGIRLMSTDSLLRSGVVMIRLWLTNSELSIAGRAGRSCPVDPGGYRVCACSWPALS